MINTINHIGVINSDKEHLICLKLGLKMYSHFFSYCTRLKCQQISCHLTRLFDVNVKQILGHDLAYMFKFSFDMLTKSLIQMFSEYPTHLTTYSQRYAVTYNLPYISKSLK